MIGLSHTEASTTEEPNAGNLHVRDWERRGVPGNRHSYRGGIEKRITNV